MRIPKVNWEKVGAYGIGGIFGMAMTWVGWKILEKNGKEPAKLFRKKTAELMDSPKIYYDPNMDEMHDKDAFAEEENDVPDLDMDYIDVEIDEDNTEGSYVVPIRTPKRSPYQIDADTWYHSEENDGVEHGRLVYYTEDKKVADENLELVPEPWRLIGVDNYHMLSDPGCDAEIYIRNEELNMDYVIEKEEGAFEVE